MIFFLYGPDDFRIREKVRNLKEKFISQVDGAGFNITTIDASDTNISDLRRAMLTQSFLAKRRMIIVKDIFQQNKDWQVELTRILNKNDFINADDNSNILVFADNKPDKKSSLFKYLQQSKWKEEFLLLKQDEIIRWIVKRVEAANGKIDGQAAAVLANRTGNDLWLTAGEVDKLIARKRNGNIVINDIEISGDKTLDDNIFGIIDAMANKNKKQALKLTEENLSAGMSEIYLLSMIARQYRIIMQIKENISEEAANIKKIASEKGWHPFVAQKAMAQSRLYSKDKLVDIYRKILEIDTRIKSTNIQPKLLLEMLIAEI